MDTLKDMIARYAQAGRITWIGLRPSRRAALHPVPAADLAEGGLVGDHARPGKRALTLIQAEHLPVIAALSGQDHVMPDTLRRNLVVAGLNLAGLRGRRLAIGPVARVEVTTICAPCSRMEAALGHGGYAAMRGHGGWCAQIITPGPVALGDTVRPLPEGAP